MSDFTDRARAEAKQRGYTTNEMVLFLLGAKWAAEQEATAAILTIVQAADEEGQRIAAGAAEVGEENWRSLVVTWGAALEQIHALLAAKEAGR